MPSSVTRIGEFSFGECDQLNDFEIKEDSKLIHIGRGAFYKSFIPKIEIPSQLQFLGKQAFCSCFNLESIKLPNNPNFRIIEDGTFHHCSKLSHVDFRNDSKIEIFGGDSFSYTKIKEITIPSSVTQICDNAFSYVNSSFMNKSNFQVEFSKDSLLQKIVNNAFHCSNVRTIEIPKKVTHIGKNVFSKCSNLTKAEIPLDSELQFIGEGAFSITKIKSLNIPSHLREIPDFMCTMSPIEKVYISDDSEIQSIEYDAFASTKIRSFKIPRNVEYLDSFAFNHCSFLLIIEIDEDSKLKSISLSSFPSKLLLMIPAKISHIEITQ